MEPTRDQLEKIEKHLTELEISQPGAITGQKGYESMPQAARKLWNIAERNPSARRYRDKVLAK